MFQLKINLPKLICIHRYIIEYYDTYLLCNFLKTSLLLKGPKCAKNSKISKKLSLEGKMFPVIIQIHRTFYFDLLFITEEFYSTYIQKLHVTFKAKNKMSF